MKIGLITNMQASVAVLALAAVAAVPLAGCTKQQQDTTTAVVQEINKYAPTVEAALESTAAAIAAADPAISGAIMTGVVAFDTLKTAFNAALMAYAANPTAGTLAALQSAINAIEANVNVASMNALRIVDPVSSALAVALLKGALTVASYVFGLISQTESTAQLNALRGTVQLTRLRPYMDEQRLKTFARADGVPKLLAGIYVDQAFSQAAAQGF